ncbi:Tyrosine-protein phosphatase pmp1 [Zalerion maritima]|uniref:protein-tyrosine-phosphatase n=1 Tax=Zalerion maritima TaxID=339359 RepID=A0AAD5WRL0_9PEZI|nr:Tyrosine-protein phosphatase pmp1 [Zalerion maritima]
MPSAAARRLYEDQIPSFMSVFDLDAETMADRDVVTVVDPKLMEVEPSCTNHTQNTTQPLRANTITADASHRHNDSTSTQSTESADSSPTTTLSTTDSGSLSDPSPSSSPDSPVNLMPLSSFSAAPFTSLNSSMASPPSLPPPPQTNANMLERPMTSPSPRRPRNMKGLSIQPVSLNNTLISEPSSPSFIKPKIPALKRKPSQLSLNTNSSDLNLRQPTLLEVPQSPGAAPPILQRRALKHSTSSPHMLSGLKSATFGPVGGMGFPAVLERNETGLSNFLRPSKSKCGLGSFDSTIVEEESPIKAQVASRAALDFEPFRESENEDKKTPGYPDGPICIYEPNVYLYLEPTADEAAKFDVVINVAREVRNPFQGFPQPPGVDQDEDALPAPETAIEGRSFDAGFAARTREQMGDSPTAPKVNSAPHKEPEYFHIPWDHNTDIQSDLMHLCETIESRSKEGKNILVHCQQGASRSASLIIAYGIYQNPKLSVNDAYYAAQSRSKWISPNMRLMYCLQDFQKEVSKNRLCPGSALKTRSGRSPTKHHRLTLSADNIERPPKEPLTAPLPNGVEKLKRETEDKSLARPRGQSTPNRGEPISSGPSSAPSSFSWTEKEDETDPGRFGRFNMDSLLPPPTKTVRKRDEELDKPPPSPGPMAPRPKPPESSPAEGSGFAPLQLNLPPLSPSFGSFDDMLKPPPSPGFAAHRFGKSGGGVTFGSLGCAKNDEDKQELKQPFGSVGLGSLERVEAKTERTPSLRGVEFVEFVADKARTAVNHTVDLPLRERQVAVTRAEPEDLALMSPRAETMTNNPLHDNDNNAGFAGMQFVEVPPTPSEGLFSPRQSMFPRDPFYPFGRPTQVDDPRSPPTKGETPIVRSIDEMI